MTWMIWEYPLSTYSLYENVCWMACTLEETLPHVSEPVAPAPSAAEALDTGHHAFESCGFSVKFSQEASLRAAVLCR